MRDEGGAFPESVRCLTGLEAVFIRVHSSLTIVHCPFPVRETAWLLLKSGETALSAGEGDDEWSTPRQRPPAARAGKFFFPG